MVVTECGFQHSFPYGIVITIALLEGFFFPVNANLDSYISKSSQCLWLQCAIADAQRKPVYIVFFFFSEGHKEQEII